MTAPPATSPTRTAVQQAPRFGWIHVAAALGAVCLVLQVWTFSSWLSDGPVQIDRFRDTNDISWTLAILYQAASVIMLLVLGTIVIRGCVRAKKLTFDAIFCIGSLCTFWLDPAANFMLPVYSYSANWINLNDWLGNLPLVRNPDGGRLPEPIVFLLPIYAVGWLLFIMAINGVMTVLKRRYPKMTNNGALAIAVVCALIVDLLFELPMFYFHLWSNQGAPRIGFFEDSGRLYPLSELVIAMVCFSVLAALRFYRDDRGETVIERAAAAYRGWRKQLLVVLAMIAIFNTLWLGMAFGWTAFGLYSGPWREMKPAVSNGVCDMPGTADTRYGPCPGSPGYRVPLPGSLKGDPPGGNDEYLNGPTQCDGCLPLRISESP